ncbi:hypothetical protein Xhom_01946 [Xenorhabdus hominickii]|uniref:Uncharacterized protein n=1 Tax=Xenorhabdus hominickii TaxID=351679 RepID=A0A2G0QB36_XENHO|nr:hypothetical protein Xhom_01946 [Xenorhabdus hominickii]
MYSIPFIFQVTALLATLTHLDHINIELAMLPGIRSQNIRFQNISAETRNSLGIT